MCGMFYLMNTRLIELAIKGLEAERASIEREIAELRQQANGRRPNTTPATTTASTDGHRRGITAAGRRKLSEMMKARWAARRKAAAKK